ncbi:phosphatidylinositol-specific phospholipase C domain-containing protein [Rhodococcus spongiicola]|uniref:Phosphoinositide phospholipase C, Ca2+-dependent n=1 Tax=Rhodococcus spongiicola TaxID=2487352 RepID=A0A438ASV9_9NOCA|nr:phosphatidylinositol-specific phospholipase C domain-containing protein [Rhodococcus spongiicola]RVW01770.1 hypothetical protein EF834_15420 [Rhodococcus spongiicola]
MLNIPRLARVSAALAPAVATVLVSLPASANAGGLPTNAGGLPTNTGVLPTNTEQLGFDDTTTVGVHNAYEKATFPYLTDALDAGAALIEIDVWTNGLGPGWRVSHTNPVGNDNNCVGAQSPGQLGTGPRDQGLDGCLADLRAWHEANPDHAPVTVKVEMKDGFNAPSIDGSSGSSNFGRGPAELDALIGAQLGDALFRPADLVGDAESTLDEAAGTNGWPTRDAMRGKFVFYLINGTVELYNPVDTVKTDVEYARHIRDLAAAGALDQAAAFPAVLGGAREADPRATRYEESIRPWFVIFDDAASAYLSEGVDTEWYRDNGYLLVMTAADSVPPVIDNRTPTEAEALERVAELAAHSASIVTSDWTAPAILSDVLPRG